MCAQRVREAESRMVKQFVKWTAEGAVNGQPSILRRQARVSGRGYDSIL